MTDQTAAIEVWARMLCATDAHLADGNHPTWQQLPTTPSPSGRTQDDYRKAARWLLPRMTVAASSAGRAPAADRAADELAKTVTRAIFALKSPAPPGSEHYRAGWDDGLEAAIDAARDAVLRRMAGEAPHTGEQP
jgi:hypothetical protein